MNNKISYRVSFLNRDSSLFDERKKPFLGEFYTSRQDYSPSRFRSGWISSSSRALKSGNAWLRHLKKTPRESAFSRANTRCRFHTGRPLLLKLFSTPGRRPTSRARGRPPKRRFNFQSPSSLPPFLPFESSPYFPRRVLSPSIDRSNGSWKSNKNPFSDPFHEILYFTSNVVPWLLSDRNIRWIWTEDGKLIRISHYTVFVIATHPLVFVNLVFRLPKDVIGDNLIYPGERATYAPLSRARLFTNSIRDVIPLK